MNTWMRGIGMCVGILVGLLCWPAGLRADPLDNWTVRHPFILPGAYYGVAYGNGLFVAYSGDGKILISGEGENWSLGSNPSGGYSGLNFANGQFFLGAFGGSMISGSDGRAWTTIRGPANNNVTDVAYGSGRYVATAEWDYAGANLTISTSGAPGTWATSKAGSTNGLEAVVFGNSRFVVVGRVGSIATSPTGTSWTVRNSGTTQNLWSVTYAAGQFVAVGDSGAILTSPDGATWTSRTSSSSQTLWRVGYGNGLFVVVGDAGTLLTSSDGISWIARSAGITTSLRGIAYGAGLFVVVGDNTVFLRSSDGITWTATTASLTGQRLTSVAYGVSNYVAVGFGLTVLTSPTGVTWTNRTSGASRGLYSVAYGNGMFAAVGQIILSSPDGINWATRSSGANYDFETVAYLNGAFMTVGTNGTMKVSSDAITWTTRNSGTTTMLYGLTYANGLYVVVGAGGLIRTSPDGINWTSRSSGTSYDLNGVTFGKGIFVAQGNGGVIVTSSDGTNWTSRTSGTGQGLATTAYGFGNYVTVGMNGTLLTSTNGTDWVTRRSPTLVLLIGIAAGPTNFVVVGDSGWILTSDPFPALGIARQPQSQTVAIGDTAQFMVEPWGAAPLSFQWFKDTTSAPTATNSALVLTNVQPADAANYSVLVSNVSGVITSSVAALTVQPIVISAQPQGQVARTGTTVTFTAGAHGLGPVTYQWLKGGIPIAGATTTSYSITNVQLSDGGGFSCVASNSYGSITSVLAVLKVSELPAVTSILLISDGIAGLYGQALPNLGLSYQSFSDDTTFGAALTNANAPSTLAVIDAFDGITVHNFTALPSFLARGGRVIFVYGNLSAGSLAAALQVNVGSSFYWSPTLVYDWGGSGFFAGVPNPINGGYQYWCGTKLQPTGNAYAVAGFTVSPTANQAATIIGNSNRSVVTSFPLDTSPVFADAIAFTQNEIQFLLAPPSPQPFLTLQPLDQTVLATHPASFSVLAAGAGKLTYQWFFNQTNPLSGATGPSFRLPSAQATNAGTYSVSVANAFGAVTSRLATLTVDLPVSLSLGPQGTNVMLSWPQTGTSYVLEENPDLNPANWQPAAGAVEAVGSLYEVSIPATNACRFFRLRKQ